MHRQRSALIVQRQNSLSKVKEEARVREKGAALQREREEEKVACEIIELFLEIEYLKSSFSLISHFRFQTFLV